MTKHVDPRNPPRVERRRPDPQVIGLAHRLGYGCDNATVAELVDSVSRERRADLLTLLAGGAIS